MEATVLLGSSLPASSSRSLRSFRDESWVRAKRLFKNGFVRVAKRYDLLRVQRQAEVEQISSSSNRKLLVHVVKWGETLTLISKMYGVSIYTIAVANLEVVDIDLVFEGQPICIPVGIEDTQIDLKRSINFTLDPMKLFSTTCMYCQLRLAKSSDCFPVLVPMIVFFITCLIKAIQHRMSTAWKHESLKKNHPPSRSRWKAALYDTAESDATDSEVKDEYSCQFEDDQSMIPIEEISLSYTELEPAYLKFLSECGMRKWGNWRGGSPQ